MVERNGVASLATANGNPRTAERRVTSILFADLVGFTPFAESLDPEDVRDFLSGYFDRCRDIIERYGGTVEKFIGDAVMAVWGVPTVHEDDAERAVRAGLDLTDMIGAYGVQIGADSLRVRVGIATGEVAVTIGAVGQGMVSGDAVNTASRVQARATPGEVWVDPQTMQLTSASVRHIDQGEHTLKGKVQPVHLYRAEAVIRALGAGPLADHLAVPLVGYRRELAQIRDTFHATVEEGRGRLILVVGEPGVGKTRLAQELQDYLDGLSTSIYWHWGQCLAYGEGTVYAALVHAVRHRLGLTDADPASVILERITTGLDDLNADAAERDWLAPRLAVLLGAGSGTYAREDLFAAWLGWFDVLGRSGQPLVWVVEDAHHADDALLDFMEHLARSASTPVLILALARPELLDRRPRFGSGRRSSLLNLEGLPDDTMGSLIDALVEDLPAPQREQLVRRADGIPLYAIETVRAMLDRDDTGTEGPSGLAPQVLAATPASLQVLVSSRLDALPPHDRSVLQDAAVLGTVFDRSDLRFLSQLNDDDLDAALARLAHRDLVGPVTDRFSPHAGSLAFVQSVVRQVAYELLSRRDRVDRHVRIANHLMDQEVAGDRAAIVAQHLTDAIALTAGNDPLRVALADQRASWLERAGDRARSVGAHREALRLYQMALAHTGEPEIRTRLQLRVAESAHASGAFDVAIAHARAIETSDPSTAAAATAMEVRALRVSGFGMEAAEALNRYPNPAALDGIDPAVASEIAYGRANLVFDGLIDDDFRVWAETAYIWAVRAGVPRLIADALNCIALRYWGQPGLAGLGLLHLHEAIRISREHHLTFQLSRLLSNQAMVLLGNDLGLALRNQREARQLLRQSGVMDWSYVSDANLCNVLWLAGAWDECLQVEAEQHHPEGGASFVESNAQKIPVMLIMHARGAAPILPTGWANLESLEPLASYTRPAHLMMVGLTYWLGGNLPKAARFAREAALDNYQHLRLEDDFLYYWKNAVEWTHAAGQYEEARNLLRLIEDEPDQWVSAWLRSALVAWRGAINASDPNVTASPDIIEADLRAGVAGLHDYGAVPDRARAQARLGTWLMRRGQTTEAHDLLAAAAATYRDLGADRWLAELPDAFREPVR